MAYCTPWLLQEIIEETASSMRTRLDVDGFQSQSPSSAQLPEIPGLPRAGARRTGGGGGTQITKGCGMWLFFLKIIFFRWQDAFGATTVLSPEPLSQTYPNPSFKGLE